MLQMVKTLFFTPTTKFQVHFGASFPNPGTFQADIEIIKMMFPEYQEIETMLPGEVWIHPTKGLENTVLAIGH